jgi:hypothetical protein
MQQQRRRLGVGASVGLPMRDGSKCGRTSRSEQRQRYFMSHISKNICFTSTSPSFLSCVCGRH